MARTASREQILVLLNAGKTPRQIARSLRLKYDHVRYLLTKHRLRLPEEGQVSTRGTSEAWKAALRGQTYRNITWDEAVRIDALALLRRKGCKCVA